MNVVGALFVVAGFILILHGLKLIPKGAEVTAISRKALAVIRWQPRQEWRFYGKGATRLMLLLRSAPHWA